MAARHRRRTEVTDHDEDPEEPYSWEAERLQEEVSERVRRQQGRPTRRALMEDALRPRLRKAGFLLRFEDYDVLVDEERYEGLRRRLPKDEDHRRLLNDDEYFGAFVDRYLPMLVKTQAKRSLHLDGEAKWYAQHARPGYRIMRVNTEVAFLKATSFSNAAGESLVGLFWAPGLHWEQANQLLLPQARRRPHLAAATAKPRAAAPGLHEDKRPTTPRSPSPAAASTSPPERRKPALSQVVLATPTLRTWPTDAPPELTAQAQRASAALQDERARSIEVLVEFDCGDDRSVLLEPTRRDPTTGRLGLPATVTTPQGRLEVQIHLKSLNDVIAISVVSRDPDVDLCQGWTLLLQAAAERLCNPADPDSVSHEPIGFTPDGPTSEKLRHYVNGHRVKLPEGHQPGADALKYADEHDIELPPDYTWRQGHIRGTKGELADGQVLRYAWRPPDHRG